MESKAYAAPGSEPRTPELTLDSRLEWSRWWRLQSSFGLALTPSQPGVYALAEEVIAPGEAGVPDGPGVGPLGSKRMLALFQVAAAEDLARALDRLFTPASPLRERIEAGRCFVRYAVVPDPAQRQAVSVALENWLAASSETASAVVQGLAGEPLPVAAPQARGATPQPAEARKISAAPPALPAGF